MRLFQLRFHYCYLTDWRHVSFCFFAGVLEQRASGVAANSTVAIRLSKIDLSPSGTALSAAHRSVAHLSDTQKSNGWDIDDCHDKRSITKHSGICFTRSIKVAKLPSTRISTKIYVKSTPTKISPIIGLINSPTKHCSMAINARPIMIHIAISVALPWQ